MVVGAASDTFCSWSNKAKKETAEPVDKGPTVPVNSHLWHHLALWLLPHSLYARLLRHKFCCVQGGLPQGKYA